MIHDHLYTTFEDYMGTLQSGQAFGGTQFLHRTKCIQGIRITEVGLSQQIAQTSSFLLSSCTLASILMQLSSISLSFSLVILLYSTLSMLNICPILFSLSRYLMISISFLQSWVSFSSTSCANSFYIAI